MKKISLLFLIFISGCATPLDDTSVVMAINNRLSHLEECAKTNPPGVKNRPEGKELNEAQKEFIRTVMDYLGEKK